MTTTDTTDGDNRLKLPDRYVLGKPLGAGGVSQVYLATDTILLKDVAIKVLQSKGQDDPQVVVRFQREAKITGQLKHRNIVDILDFGITGSGHPYIVMDYIVGESLSEILDRVGNISEREALPLMLEILSAVEYAHKQNILHRDLKPGNILIQQKDNVDVVKLIDFGIAKLADPDQSLTTSGSVIGTPAYMSPEQARAQNIDARSEIYSLGCLLFHMLAGQPPFQAENTFELLNLHCDAAPPTLNDIQPDLTFSPGIQTIISACLEKDPEKRIQTVAELVRQLREIDEALRARETDATTNSGSLTGTFRLAQTSTTAFSVRTKAALIVAAAVAIVILGVTVLQILNAPQEATVTEPTSALSETGIAGALQHVNERDNKLIISPDVNGRMLHSMMPGTLKDATLKTAANMTGYVHLKLRGEPIDGSGLKYIHNPNLQKIDLTDVKLSKDGWQALSKLTSVEYLWLERVKLQPENIHTLAALKNLKNLYIQLGPELGRKEFAALAHLPALQNLTIYGPGRLPPQALAELVKSKTLNQIGLEHLDLRAEDLRPLRQAKPGFYLSLSRQPLDQSLLDEIAHLKLKQFAIAESDFTPENLFSLKTLQADEIQIVNCPGGVTKQDWDTYQRLIKTRKVRFSVRDERSASAKRSKNGNSELLEPLNLN
jgi:tRNA A-37 threonylcarbamoyl transferase component Bud32